MALQRRLKGSNRGSTMGVLQSRWGVLTPARSVCAPGRTAWRTPQGEYLVTILIIYYFFKIIFFFIAIPLSVLGASHSSSGVYPTLIPTPWP